MNIFLRNILLTGAVMLVAPFMVLAADVTVTCDNSGCSHAPIGSLFTVNNAVPGTSESRSIEVVNQRDYVCDIVLNVKGGRENPTGFTAMLNTEITGGGQTYWNGGSLADLYQDANVDLGAVSVGGSKTYDWLIGLDQSAGNTWQAATASFDFDLNFSCEEFGGSENGTTDSNGGNGSGGDGGGGDEATIESQATGQVAGIRNAVSRVLGLGGANKLTRFPAAGTQGESEINGRDGWPIRLVVGWIIILACLVVLVRYNWRTVNIGN